MPSKFHGLKNKGKSRGKSVNETADLPKTVEVNEELIKQQESAPALTSEEIKTLMDGLNEAAEIEIIENAVLPNITIVEETSNLAETDDSIFEAYGICYSEPLKKFMKITLDYNPKTGYSKFKAIEPWADSAPTALNKLNKVLSLKLLKREEKY